MHYFHKALSIYKSNLGDANLFTAEIYNEVGGIYSERMEYDSALESHELALSIYKRVLGDTAAEVGHTLQSIGAVYDSKEDLDGSLKYYSEALSILKSALGNEDLSVALVLHNLAINLSQRQQFQKAIELCTESLRIRRIKKKGSIDVADTLFCVGNILSDWGKKDNQSMKFFVEALTIYRSNFGDENEDVASCLKNIGLIYMQKGQAFFNMAVSNLSDALKIFRMKQGKDSLEVSGVLFSLGQIYGKKIEYQKAHGCFRECLRIRLKHYDVNDTEVVIVEKYLNTLQKKTRP